MTTTATPTETVTHSVHEQTRHPYKWVLAFRVNDVLTHYELERFAGRPIGSLEKAEEVGLQWLQQRGVYAVRCPTCQARPGQSCTVRARLGNADRRATQPHKARLRVVGGELELSASELWQEHKGWSNS
jgi:hypothetical protein